MTVVKNDLFDYKNRYIYQETEGFKFSLDSILLAEFTKIPTKEVNILDMCTGNAPIPLILSTKTKSPITCFEIQKDIYELGKKSIIENKLTEQINLINDNVKNISTLFPGKYFDIITCNPPYFATPINGNLNKNDLLTLARHEIAINIDDIFAIVSKHLKDNGSFYLVHRIERLDEIIITAQKYKLKLKELQIIITKQNKPSIILMQFQKNAKYGIKIKDIINVNNLKTYQHLFDD